MKGNFDTSISAKRFTSVISVNSKLEAHSSKLIEHLNIGNKLLRGRRLDGFFDTGVGTAATNIAVHGSLNFLVAGARIGFQQGGGGHDLAGLTVAALWHVVFQPGLLQRVIAVFRQALDGGDGLLAYCRNGQRAGAHGGVFEMHGAGPALSDAAAVFGAHELQVVAQHPEQRGGGVHVHLPGLAIDVEGEGCHDGGVLIKR